MSTRAIVPPEWMLDGLCGQVDPELFFPDAGRGNSAARRICRACPVVALCRDYALAHTELTGFWGDTTERERRRMRARPTPCADCGADLPKDASRNTKRCADCAKKAHREQKTRHDRAKAVA